MAHVELEDVRKVYDDEVVAVEGASFEAKDGEFVVLVGPSGCGKSTLLRTIAGLETATGGHIRIGGQEVSHLPPKERDVAMVFQNYALYPHMSVYENMAFGLKMRKFARDEIDRRVQNAAQILEIEEILDRRPRALSGGQRQRVAVGRAIVREPKVFLFDEPLSNLDAKLRAGMRTELKKLHNRLGATMMYVTHDQTEAMTMGDRIVVLRSGRLQQVAAPLDLYNHPANRFVADFIGSPSMNLIDGTLTRTDGGLRFQAGTFVLPVDSEQAGGLEGHVGEAVTMGIRPENIYYTSDARFDFPSAEAEFTLEVVEPMGNETVIYTRADGLTEPIVARLEPQALPEVETPIALSFDLKKLHFFDVETSKVLETEVATTTA